MRSTFKLYAIVASLAIGIAFGGMMTGCSDQPPTGSDSTEVESSNSERFGEKYKELVVALSHAVPQVSEDGEVTDSSLSLIVTTEQIPKLTELAGLSDKVGKFSRYCAVFNTDDIGKFFVGVIEANLDTVGSDEMELANLETSIGEALTVSGNPYMIRRIGKYILLQIGETGDVDSAAFASQISQLAGIEENREVATGMTGQEEVSGGVKESNGDSDEASDSSSSGSGDAAVPEEQTAGNSQGGELTAPPSDDVRASGDEAGSEWILSDGTAAVDASESNSDVNAALLKDDSAKAAAKAKAATDSSVDAGNVQENQTAQGGSSAGEAVGGPAADVGLDMSGLDDVIHRAEDPAFGTHGDGKPKNAD